MSASICYQNLLEDASSVTASTTVDGDVANVYDWLLNDYWQGTGAATDNIKIDLGLTGGKAVDYIGIAGHTLNSTGATWRLMYSDDDSTYHLLDQYEDNDAVAFLTEGNEFDADGALALSDRVIIRTFRPIRARYWKLEIFNGATAAVISQLSLGKRWDLPVGMQPGFVPVHLSDNPRLLTNLNESGTFIGRSLLRNNYQTMIEMKLLTRENVRDDLEPFIEHAHKKPFFFMWDSVRYPRECAYLWATDKVQVNTPSPIYYSAMVNVEGVI